MKKRISLFMAAIMVLTVMLSAIPIAAATNTFNASDANPTISTAEDYIAFFKAAFIDKTSDFSGKTITMLNDITINETSASNWYAKAGAVKFVPTNTDWKWFNGTFDGGNHTLKGVIVEGTFRDDMVTGIFPYVGNNGSIKNLVIDGFYVCSDNTTEAVNDTNIRIGTGGLIGLAKENVSVDSVTMKNGTVTCVENGVGALGAVVGTYGAGKANQTLTLTNVKVEPTVKVVAPESANVYMGGLIGHVVDSMADYIIVNLSGSSISPNGSYGESRTLQPVGRFKFKTTGGYKWTIVCDSYSKDIIMHSNVYTDAYNSAIIAARCYGLADVVIAGNTFNANDANPTISTAEDYVSFFQAVWKDGTEFIGKTVTMLDDIVLNDTTVSDWYNNSDTVKLETSSSAAWFKGTFDGGNHTLTGGVIDTTCARWDAATGLFPCVGFGATIKNLTVDGFYVCSPNTSNDPAYGNAGIGGLIGHAKANVTVDNVTMKNGIVTCVANGKGGLGAVVGAYDGQEANQQLKITNTTVENTVKVIGGNDNVYVGGIIGYVHENFKSHSTVIDFSGSVFQPYGANDSLAPIGSFKAGGAVGDVAFSWTFKNINNSYSKLFELSAGRDYTADWNEAIIAAGCYGATAAVTVDFVGIQTRSSDNGARFVGLIKAVDLEQISSLGFEITVGGKTVGPDVIKCTKVYASIVEDGTPLAAPEGYYYFTFVITGVADNTSFDVKACATVNGTNYVTAVGTCVYPPVEA